MVAKTVRDREIIKMDFFCSKSIYIDNHKRDLNEELALKLYEKLFIFNASIYLLAYYKSICHKLKL